MNHNNNTILYATVCINYKKIIAISKLQDHYMTYFTPKILIPQGQVFLTHHHFQCANVCTSRFCYVYLLFAKSISDTNIKKADLNTSTSFILLNASKSIGFDPKIRL